MAWKMDWSPAAEEALAVVLSSLGKSLVELPSQQWEPSSLTIGGVRDYLCAHIGPGLPGWSLILLPLNAGFYKKLGQRLSKESMTVLSFTEAHQAAWGYSLWQNGKRVDMFWNEPGTVEEKFEKCRGNATLLAGACQVEASSIARYLQHWSDESTSSKAYPDDKFERGNHWVRVDLMRRLGIGYPDFASPFSPGRYLLIEESKQSASSGR